ncbi:MAG: hypothetical protein ACWGO1_15870, partial [Anaerolineales bacterium]
VSPTLNLEGELPSPSWLEIEPHETLPEAGYPVGAREKYSQPGIVPLIENSPQETTTDNKGEAFLSDNQNTADASQEGAGEVGAKEKLGVQVSPRIIKTELRLHQHVDDLQDGQAQPLGENAVVRPRPAASAAEHKATGHKASIGSPTLPGSPKGSTPAGDQPQPVIRVTIGRVEVRAVAAPAPPSPRLAPPRPKPALSLQEYLEQRSGGER